MSDGKTDYKNKTHYELLGVAENATPAEIKEAFGRFARLHHPDVIQRDTGKTANKAELDYFQTVSAARDVLKDSKARKEYDRTLKSQDFSGEKPGGFAEAYARQQADSQQNNEQKRKQTNDKSRNAERRKDIDDYIKLYQKNPAELSVAWIINYLEQRLIFDEKSVYFLKLIVEAAKQNPQSIQSSDLNGINHLGILAGLSGLPGLLTAEKIKAAVSTSLATIFGFGRNKFSDVNIENLLTIYKNNPALLASIAADSPVKQENCFYMDRDYAKFWESMFALVKTPEVTLNLDGITRFDLLCQVPHLVKARHLHAAFEKHPYPRGLYDAALTKEAFLLKIYAKNPALMGETALALLLRLEKLEGRFYPTKPLIDQLVQAVQDKRIKVNLGKMGDFTDPWQIISLSRIPGLVSDAKILELLESQKDAVLAGTYMDNSKADELVRMYGLRPDLASQALRAALIKDYGKPNFGAFYEHMGYENILPPDLLDGIVDPNILSKGFINKNLRPHQFLAALIAPENQSVKQQLIRDLIDVRLVTEETLPHLIPFLAVADEYIHRSVLYTIERAVETGRVAIQERHLAAIPSLEALLEIALFKAPDNKGASLTPAHLSAFLKDRTIFNTPKVIEQYAHLFVKLYEKQPELISSTLLPVIAAMVTGNATLSGKEREAHAAPLVNAFAGELAWEKVRDMADARLAWQLLKKDPGSVFHYVKKTITQHPLATAIIGAGAVAIIGTGWYVTHRSPPPAVPARESLHSKLNKKPAQTLTL